VDFQVCEKSTLHLDGLVECKVFEQLINPLKPDLLDQMGAFLLTLLEEILLNDLGVRFAKNMDFQFAVRLGQVYDRINPVFFRIGNPIQRKVSTV